jgi:hypothetical protein
MYRRELIPRVLQLSLPSPCITALQCARWTRCPTRRWQGACRSIVFAVALLLTGSERQRTALFLSAPSRSPLPLHGPRYLLKRGACIAIFRLWPILFLGLGNLRLECRRAVGEDGQVHFVLDGGFFISSCSKHRGLSRTAVASQHTP